LIYKITPGKREELFVLAGKVSKKDSCHFLLEHNTLRGLFLILYINEINNFSNFNNFNIPLLCPGNVLRF